MGISSHRLKEGSFLEKISLDLVKNQKELSKILGFQKRAFKELYLKYRDTETSPYKESLQNIKRGFAMESSLYYFIEVSSTMIGFIRIVISANQTTARISPIAILPEFENKGYGKQTIYEIERLFPDITEWNLDTIEEEMKLIRFYLNLRYVKLEKEEKINENMHISFFRKVIE